MAWLYSFLISILFSIQLGALSAPKFEKQVVVVAHKTLVLDVADTSDRQAYGLMNRSKMAADEGMIFVFPNESTRSFWMKNTLIDLDIAYVNSKGVIIDIQEMKSGKNVKDDSLLPSYVSKQPAMYAIEMNKGWFKKNGIKVGDIIKIKKP